MIAGVGEGLGFFTNQMVAGLSIHPNGPGPSGSWNNGNGVVAAAIATPQTPTPTPQQKQAACQAQYQQGISDARSALKTQFLVFFTAVGIPGDLGLIGCLGTGEFAPACMEGVELALGGPSILGTLALSISTTPP